jgi:hypothetical protein
MQGHGKIIIILIIIIIIINFSQTTITNFSCKIKLNLNTAINSHPAYTNCVPPINSTPLPYLRLTWSSVPWVKLEAVTGVEWSGHHLEFYYDTR